VVYFGPPLARIKEFGAFYAFCGIFLMLSLF